MSKELSQQERDKLRRSETLTDVIMDENPDRMYHVMVYPQLPPELWTTPLLKGRPMTNDVGNEMLAAQADFAAQTWRDIENAGYQVRSSEALALDTGRICVTGTGKEIQKLLLRENIRYGQLLPEAAAGSNMQEMDGLAKGRIPQGRGVRT